MGYIFLKNEVCSEFLKKQFPEIHKLIWKT